MEPKNINIDEMTFQMSPLNPLLALRLDKRIISLILPAFKAIGGLDSQIDLGKIMEALSESLSTLPDDDFEKFVLNILSRTVCIQKNKPPLEINEENFGIIFAGKLTTIYKLLWEVMKYNKFSPFVVAGGGAEALKTLTSIFPTSEKKKSGEELEILDN